MGSVFIAGWLSGISVAWPGSVTALGQTSHDELDEVTYSNFTRCLGADRLVRDRDRLAWRRLTGAVLALDLERDFARNRDLAPRLRTVFAAGLRPRRAVRATVVDRARLLATERLRRAVDLARERVVLAFDLAGVRALVRRRDLLAVLLVRRWDLLAVLLVRCRDLLADLVLLAALRGRRAEVDRARRLTPGLRNGTAISSKGVRWAGCSRFHTLAPSMAVWTADLWRLFGWAR